MEVPTQDPSLQSPGDFHSLSSHCSLVGHFLGSGRSLSSRLPEFTAQTTPSCFQAVCPPVGGPATSVWPWVWVELGVVYLKGRWMELGRVVCGVHAQTREVPYGTGGVGSLGGYPRMTLFLLSLSRTFSSSSPHCCQGRQTEPVFLTVWLHLYSCLRTHKC